MSKEFRSISLGFTVLDPDDLPNDMYADDVAGELQDVVNAAVRQWYGERGHEFLACEPV